MNLRTGLIAVVVAAAGGAAAARALAPPARAPVLDLGVARTAASDASVASPPQRPAASSARHGSVVYVAGEVVRPGVYRVVSDARAVDALHLAGGPTKSADLVAVNLAAVVEDGTEIVVPARGAEPSVVSAGATRSRVTRSRVTRSHRRTGTTTRHRRKRANPVDSGSNDSAAATLNLNAADAMALETLPGIGPALAERIVEFRNVNGAFASTDELLDVAGMTQSKVDELAPYVTF